MEEWDKYILHSGNSRDRSHLRGERVVFVVVHLSGQGSGSGHGRSLASR